MISDDLWILGLSIGATIAVLGLISLLLAPELITGDPLARVLCGLTALFWAGRLAILPWLRVRGSAPRIWLCAPLYSAETSADLPPGMNPATSQPWE